MKTEPRRGEVERAVVIDCVVNSAFLARLASLHKDPFRSGGANLIFRWCREHHVKYGEAPGRQVQSVFASWAEKADDKDLKLMVERLLSSLSDEYDRADLPALNFSLDRAEALFNEVLAERLRDSLAQRLEQGKPSMAVEEARKFREVTLKNQNWTDVLSDEQAHREALEHVATPLIRFKGDACDFFGTEFSEDSFVGVMAQVKGGKSYTLMHLAWLAVSQGKRVAYFQVGDMSSNQILMRFLKRAVYRPSRAGVVRYPVGLLLGEGDERGLATVEHEPRQYDEPISWPTARRALRKHQEKTGGPDRIRLSWHAIGTVNALQIRSLLDGWEDGGFKPDVVVIDYAANMAPVDPKMPKHEQVDMTWGLLRQISQVKKNCVITASQSNKEGFRSWVLTRNNFRDSLMILGHVTAFLGINVTDEEKQYGVIRYNFVVRREDEFSETHCLYAAHCLAVSNPMVLTRLPKRGT